jgi:hypothetical protein
MDQDIENRIEGLENFLATQDIDVKEEQAHLNDGSRERLYWHYGYLMALKDMRRKGAH